MLQMSQDKMPYSNSGYKGVNQKLFHVFTIHTCISLPFSLQPNISGLANQELLPTFLHAMPSPVLYDSYPAHLATPDSYSKIAQHTIK